MTRHDLIAILPGVHTIPADLNVISQHVGDHTVVLDRQTAPAIRLPVDRKTELQNAVTRQRIFERLMLQSTVLPALPRQPLAFSDAERLVQANRPLLIEAKERLAGRSQFQIIVDWKQDSVLERFRDTAEIAPLFDLGKVSEETLTRATGDLRFRLGNEIEAQLTRVSQDLITTPGGPDTVFSGVVLVADADLPHLDQCVEKIDDIWSEGFRIQQIGPAPAASFLSLQMLWIRPPMLHQARELFETTAWPAPEQVATIRKALLRRLDASQANQIRQAAEILNAAAHLPEPEQGFPLLRRWSEGTADVAQTDKQVA